MLLENIPLAEAQTVLHEEVENEAVGVAQEEGLRLEEAQADEERHNVVVGEEELERDGDSVAVAHPDAVPLSDPRAETEPVPVPHLLAEGQELAEPPPRVPLLLPLLHPEPLGDREALPHTVLLAQTVLAALSDAERQQLPLDEAHLEGALEADRDGLVVEQIEMELLLLAHPLDDKQCEAVGLVEVLREGTAEVDREPVPERDALPHPLPDSVPLPLPLPLPHAVKVAAAELVSPPSPPPPTPPPPPLPLGERLPHALLQADSVPHAVADPQSDGAPEAVGQGVGETLPFAVGETLGDAVEERQRLAVEQLEGVGVADTDADAQCEADTVLLSMPLGEGVPLPLRLTLEQAVADTVKLTVLLPLAHPL